MSIAMPDNALVAPNAFTITTRITKMVTPPRWSKRKVIPKAAATTDPFCILNESCTVCNITHRSEVKDEKIFGNEKLTSKQKDFVQCRYLQAGQLINKLPNQNSKCSHGGSFHQAIDGYQQKWIRPYCQHQQPHCKLPHPARPHPQQYKKGYVLIAAYTTKHSDV